MMMHSRLKRKVDDSVHPSIEVIEDESQSAKSTVINNDDMHNEKINNMRTPIYKCLVCSKEFAQKSSLTRHNQTHLKEKPWICDFKNCGKRFKLKEYLEAHKRSHYKSAYETITAHTTLGNNNHNIQHFHQQLYQQQPNQSSQQQQQQQQQEQQLLQLDAVNDLIYNEFKVSLLRSNVNYYQERIGQYEQREQHLLESLEEVSAALDRSVHMLKECIGAVNIPLDIVLTANRFSQSSW